MKAVGLSANRIKNLARSVLDNLHYGIGSVFEYQFRQPADDFATIVVFHGDRDGPAGELSLITVGYF